MRKSLATTLLFTVALVGACHRSGSNAGKDVAHPGDSAVVNTGQDVAAAQVGLASATVVGGFNTKAFVANAAMGDMYEIEAGKIALQRSTSPKVKAMAQMMITDHEKLDGQLKTAVSSNGVDAPIPTDLDARRSGMINNLKASGDSDFDLAYLHQQLAAHLETLDLMKGFQNHGDNDALKKTAGEAAPVVEHHIAMIRDVGGAKLKGADPK